MYTCERRKRGLFGTHICTMSYIGYPPPPPPDDGAGSVEKQKAAVLSCSPWPSKICVMHIHLHRCLVKFYRRYYDMISKFNVGLKSLLRQGLSEPDFYGGLVYKLKKIVGSINFSAQFIKIISYYKKIGYNINVLQQTACLVVNPITVGNFAFLFNCTPVGRTSDSMMVPT